MVVFIVGLLPKHSINIHLSSLAEKQFLINFAPTINCVQARISNILVRRAFQKKTTKFWICVQIRSTLRTLYPNMGKKKFGQVLFCLPYLPTYPESFDILESKFALFQIFLILSEIQINTIFGSHP